MTAPRPGCRIDAGMRSPPTDTSVARALPEALRREAQPLSGAAEDYDGLLDRIGDASFVLLGEGSHGTHEFYRERARITRRLIEEKGFRAVAVEADWPDAYRVNRYVRGARDDADAEEALGGFRRFPTWMWRNAEVLDFVGWLRAHNDRRWTGGRGGLLRPRPLQPVRLGRRGDRAISRRSTRSPPSGRASATRASSSSAASRPTGAPSASGSASRVAGTSSRS